MPGTSKLLRTAPARRFENYVLTRAIDSNIGLTDVNDKYFTKITAASEINDGDGVTVTISIGFNFQIDGITYNKVAVDPNGWAALVDPALGTFSSAEVLAGADDSNAQIKSLFTSNALLLAPWFDKLRNVLSDVSHLAVTPWFYTQEKIQRISMGLEPPPPYWNPTSYGTSYYLDRHCDKGKRLIIRWSCITNFAGNQTNNLKFEAVLYENGTIEFRYAPLVIAPIVNVTSTEDEHATVGIFAPGQNRFRDFSPGLGYRNNRPRYKYGGAVYDLSFTDDGEGAQNDGYTGITYVHNLWASRNWPGSTEAGCIFTFAPPVNKRKILPRNLLRERDARNNMPIIARTGYGMPSNRAFQRFDDRRTIAYVTGTVINYPTTLERFYGGDTTDTTERQDLFTGDFLVTASISQSAIEQYTEISRNNTKIEPFNETNKVEQSQSATNVSNLYFMSGSLPELYAGFDKSLKSKTQVRISLPVDYNIQMPGLTSSIYYYNSRTHSWNVPQKSSPSLLSSSTTSTSGGDWSSSTTWHSSSGGPIHGKWINEDARGFSAFGNIVASGSNEVTNTVIDQTDVEIFSEYDPKTVVRALNKTFSKSVRVNYEYQPNIDETFKLPITEPFLIEKAVIELPFSAGPGWFNDNTRCWRPRNDDYLCGLNLSGPALTVALFRKVQFGRDFSKMGKGRTSSVLDLILTGTIIPVGDDISKLRIDYVRPNAGPYPNPSIQKVFFASAYGFRTAGYPAAAVVSANQSSYFTGSVTLNTTALNAVGELLIMYDSIFFDSALKIEPVYSFFQSRDTINLLNSNIIASDNNAYVYSAQFAPFGRAQSGLVPSGRSALGRELSTLQRRSDNAGTYARNPFYVGADGLTTNADYAYIPTFLEWLRAQIALAQTHLVEFAAPIPNISNEPCPYLVMPDDELALSISKMHPVVFEGAGQYPWLSGSAVQHDVGLITGSINITFYGSLIRENSEFHDPSSQRVGSEAIHEVIGNEPIVDQFDTAYSRELSGSSKSRFSISQAVDYLHFGAGGSEKHSVDGGEPIITSSYYTQKYYDSNPENDDQRNDSWSTQMSWSTVKRVFELKKSSRTLAHISDSEIYYDCRLPEPASMLTVQSPGIILAATVTGGMISDFILYTGREVLPPATDGGLLGSGSRGLGDWIMSYPFENRWRSVTHVLGDKLRGGTYRCADYTGAVRTSPVFVTYGRMSFLYGRYAFGVKRLATDKAAFAAVANSCSGIGLPEFIKFMYGFGDGRSMEQDNCYVDFRGGNPSAGFYYGAEIRGWRHGVISGFPLRTSAIFRNNKFGQLRDMLEQRPNTKFFTSSSLGAQSGQAAVEVRFVDNEGRTTQPEFTYSSNLSFECTSSLPYFDGLVRNREEPISLARTNQSLVVI